MTEPQELFDQLLDELAAAIRYGPPPSPRGREVLYQRVVLGRGNTAVASALGISVKVVEFHMRQSADRLEYESTPTLVRELLEAYLERKVRAEILATPS